MAKAGPEFRWKTALGTLAIAAAGGGIADLAGLPLPWLMGAQIALCAVALSQTRIFGAPPQWPQATRSIFVPVLGAMVGGSFTMDVVKGIVDWWPTVLALSAYLLAVHGLVFAFFLRVGRYDPPTAYFAASPGGFIEAALLGASVGGSERIIVVQHFLRVSLIAFLVPLIFWVAEGKAVGSAAGAATDGTGSLDLPELAILAIATIAGTLIARRIRLPAADIAGAIAASALVHMAGLVHGSLPPALIALTQLMIGTSLGVGFAGVSRHEILRAMGLALAAFAIVFTSAFLVALALSGVLHTSIEEVVLSFAPGGLAEMSLIAVSLQLSVPFVALHHLYRILFTLTVLPRLFRLLERRFAE